MPQESPVGRRHCGPVVSTVVCPGGAARHGRWARLRQVTAFMGCSSDGGADCRAARLWHRRVGAWDLAGALRRRTRALPSGPRPRKQWRPADVGGGGSSAATTGRHLHPRAATSARSRRRGAAARRARIWKERRTTSGGVNRERHDEPPLGDLDVADVLHPLASSSASPVLRLRLMSPLSNGDTFRARRGCSRGR